MNKHDPFCIKLKRDGAQYVEKLLTGKSSKEELAFWNKRTKKLRETYLKDNVSQ